MHTFTYTFSQFETTGTFYYAFAHLCVNAGSCYNPVHSTFLFLEQRMSVKAHQPSCYIRSLVLAVDPAVRTKTQLCQK